MRLAVVVVIAIAALFAGGVFYFLLQYMEGVERDALEFAEASKPGIDAVEVLVADIDLPAGTEIVSTILDWQPWPDDSLGDGYVVYNEDDDDADQSSLEEPFYDQIVRRTILAGEPITQAKLFTREGSSFLSGMLAPGMRAVAIRVQEVSGVGGFILPGDRVDVIVSLKWKIDQDARKSGAPYIEFTSETIVQNARVMGIDQAFDDFEENVSKASAVTIEVTPKQAEIIAVAQSKGELTLSLRSLIPGLVGTIQGFTSDRETLFSMGGGFPATDRLAQPVVVANSEAGGGASSDARPLPGIQVFRAMTARRDLPRGTLLRESDVDWADLSPGLRPEDYVIQGREAVTPLFLVGVLLNADIKAGKPLPSSDLYTSKNAEFLSLALRPGMRAASLQNLSNLFAGTPGDEVDIVLTGQIQDHRFSETILQRVRILIASAQGSATATVEVSPKQFETLAVAQTVGAIQLSLRSANTLVSDIYGGKFTSELEISRAISGGIEALVASGNAGPSEQDMVVAAIHTNVLVAVRDLDVGTLLRDTDFRFSVLESAIPPDAEYFVKATTNIAALRGALVTQAIAAYEVLSAGKLIKPGSQGFLAAALSDGMRAVSVNIDSASGVSGYVSAGERIDLLMTYTVKFEKYERKWSETILQNVRVLAIEQGMDAATGKPTVGGTVTVELFPNQVEILKVATIFGEVSMSLRGPPSDAKPEFGASYTSEFGAGAAIFEYLGGGKAIGAADHDSVSTPPFSRSAIRILVAVRNLAKGTLLKDSDFRFDPIEGGIPPDAGHIVMGSTVIDTLRGALVKSAIAADEVILAKALFKPNAQGFLAAAIRPGMRAVSIAINEVTGVSGFVSPGDIVDVIMSHKVEDTSENPIFTPRQYAETVVRKTRVVAVEQLINPSSGNPVAGKTVTLEVTSKQAETLAVAKNLGALSLALLSGSLAEAEPQASPFTSDIEISKATMSFIQGTESIYGGQSTTPAPAPAPVTAPATAPRVVKKEKTSIKIYRSTSTTQQSVSQ